jgi:hypothetical protein
VYTMMKRALIMIGGFLLFSGVAAAQDCDAPVPDNIKERCASEQWKPVGDRRIAFCYSRNTAGPIVEYLTHTRFPQPGSWSCGDVVCWSWNDEGGLRGLALFCCPTDLSGMIRWLHL